MWLLLGQLWHKIGLLFIPKSGPTGKTILFCQELSVQCDQIGRFLEFLDHEFYYKSRPNVWWLFGQLQNPSLFKSNWLRYILGNFWKNLGYFLFQHLVIDVIKNGNLSSIVFDKSIVSFDLINYVWMESGPKWCHLDSNVFETRWWSNSCCDKLMTIKITQNKMMR